MDKFKEDELIERLKEINRQIEKIINEIKEDKNV